MHHVRDRFQILHRVAGLVGTAATRTDAFVQAEDFRDGTEVHKLTVYDSMANIGNWSTWTWQPFAEERRKQHTIRNDRFIRTNWVPTGKRRPDRI